MIPRKVQLMLRRIRASRLRAKYAEIWPIYEQAGEQPDNWQGWPENKQFAVVLTHDVESEIGMKRCRKLAGIDKKYKFRSLFNFVPGRYRVPCELRDYLLSINFEVGLHGLFHDGKLFQSKSIFRKRAKIINSYLKDWKAVGFRSPAMHHNIKWMQELNIEYDLSTFDVDPFEPQPEGVNTIFPFWVSDNNSSKGFVEMPYTLAQDHNLFIILQEKNIDIWKKKADWIVQMGGMILLNTHPDYMNFGSKALSLEEYSVKHYENFLSYIKNNYKNQYWHALPREISRFWSSRYQPKQISKK